ncbi:MAG: response regulator [Alphaproteobacteria bacterium]|nr:response regulator [Alphaproteobacteria bacterium]
MARILIADDDPMVVQLVEFKLTRRGHQVVSATDGASALDVATRERPDLVVLDAMMPALSGVEVLRRLSENADTASIPVVMLTARRREQDVVEALKLGARKYLVKPFMPEELMARIEAILAAQKTAPRRAP